MASGLEDKDSQIGRLQQDQASLQVQVTQCQQQVAKLQADLLQVHLQVLGLSAVCIAFCDLDAVL